jgi:hypothetical protein
MRKTSLSLAVSSLLSMSLFFHELFLKGSSKSICGPLFPRILGGRTGSTYIYSMDLYEDVTVVGGHTSEPALKGGITTAEDLGYIA